MGTKFFCSVPARPLIPDPPDTSVALRASGRVYLRYEDVCQDGRVMLRAMPHSVGLVWRKMLSDHGVARMSRRDGIVAILTRMVVAGDVGTVSVNAPLSATGFYEISHTVDDDGQINRLLLKIWVDLHGIEGRTYEPRPTGEPTIVSVGRVFAEHVFTRPFGPRGERKVLALTDEELAAVPEVRDVWRPLPDIQRLPESATPIDALSLDPMPVVFGLNDTDSNQHVNSLVYPRLFEEAAMRRFSALGREVKLLSRQSEIGYRKPAFAGDHVRIALQAFEVGDKLGAVGCFLPADGATLDASHLSRAHCYCRMLFEP